MCMHVILEESYQTLYVSRHETFCRYTEYLLVIHVFFYLFNQKMYCDTCILYYIISITTSNRWQNWNIHKRGTNDIGLDTSKWWSVDLLVCSYNNKIIKYVDTFVFYLNLSLSLNTVHIEETSKVWTVLVLFNSVKYNKLTDVGAQSLGVSLRNCKKMKTLRWESLVCIMWVCVRSALFPVHHF